MFHHDSVSVRLPTKFCQPYEQVAAVLQQSGGQPGDLLLVAAGGGALVHRTLDRVRQFVARELKMVDESAQCLLWVTDFPMFEHNEEEGRLEVSGGGNFEFQISILNSYA